MSENAISLMFSGGVDSTMAAIKLSEEYAKVHLLTYRNGYGHFFLGNSKKRAKELINKFGNKFVHNLIPIEDLFKKMVLDTLQEDYRELGSGFIWCLGCKMTMHTRSIIYNLEHNIKFMADGSSQDSDEMVEQMAISVSLISLFYERYGIKFLVPVYKQTREEKITKLEELKFKMGIRIKDRFLGIQPRCIPGELYYLPYLLFNKALEHEKPLVTQYIKKKQEIADRYIEEYFKHGKVL
jgi:predicted subunit of tRNA(5-methylaminomethyl-2-thiouridylate) methyltransferase